MNIKQLKPENNTDKILNDMMLKCANNMISVGVPVQLANVVGIYAKTLKNTNACCFYRYEKNNQLSFVICINKKVEKFLHDEDVKKNVENSIYHELLHTIKGCHEGHGEEWLKWSKICDQRLDTNTLRYKEREIYYNSKKESRALVYVCNHCGHEYWAVNKIDDTTCEICKNEMHIKK